MNFFGEIEEVMACTLNISRLGALGRVWFINIDWAKPGGSVAFPPVI
jgi:hypothetical protein